MVLNKKNFLFLLIVSIIFTQYFFSVSTVLADEISPTELLGNPGFEGTYTIVASSWQNISSNIAINCSKDTNNPHGGSASQKISIPVASNFVTNAAMFGQPRTFKGGITYEGSVWLKSSDGAIVRFSLLAEGNWTDPGAVQLVKLTPTWTKYTIRGGWDTNKSGYFGFYFISTGTVWMDDASLREVINNTDYVVTQNAIPETFFGMHVTHCFDPRTSYRYNTWPVNLQFKYLRLWDTWVTWMDIEPTKGNWNWTTFDLYVSTAVQYNKEIIYTLGRIPTWASSKPTDPKPNIAAPQNIEDWRNYVRTVATRYKGKIKYWEMWNETNTQSFYTGTTEKMLEMTIAAREELKAVDPNNVILSPNVVNGDEWLDKFLYLGGGQYVDIISIHRYSSFKPELEQPYYASVKNVMDHHGIGNKPIWDTEGATWGTPPSAADAVGALARMYILRWAWGFSNFCWYGWDLDVGNPLSQPNHIQPTASGIAYDEVVKWLQGNQMMNIQHDTNGTWIVDIKQADGTLSYIVWNQNGTQVFNIPANWSIQNKKDLAGLATDVTPGSSISIGVSPVLIGAGTGAIQDTIAPAQITSLGIVNVASTGVTLNWTAVGDDGTTGTASSYDIRYATYNINAGNWNTLTQYTSEPDPKVSGSNESLTINGLLSDTTYYFGIKSWDDVLNLSAISNIISRKTSAITQFKGQWHLDEGTGTIAQDTSGNNNIGTLTNGPIWVDGKSGKAVKFDGVNDNISVPNSASLNMGTQDFTITAWANFDELTTARHGIIAKITGDPTNGPAMGYGYMIHVHNNKYLRFSVTGGVNIYRFAQYALTGANVTGWHFVTGTWNAATNTAKLYLDGSEVASNTFASGTVGNIDNTNNLVIGSTYKGILDEVYIWNRALSANEVLAEYNPGLTDITAPQSINNLNITNLSSNTVTLSWTAVGDDGTTGTANSYDIRYATYIINNGNFSAAGSPVGEPTPKTAGNSENFIINNLIPNTTYYFAIKVADEIPNTSGISNIISGKTATPPPNVNSIYYVDTNGNNTNNGTALSTPFKTIQKAASVMVAGDICYIRQGTYRETVIPTNSGTSANPIRFYAYNNETVTVSGADVLTSTWTVHSGSIYKAPTSLNFIQLFVDGRMMNEARWPNAVVDDLLHMPRATPDTGSNISTIVDSELPAGDWNNANVQLMFGYSGYVKKVVNYQAGNRFNFDSADTGGNGPQAGTSKYYMFGKLIALDTATEWYLDNVSHIVYLWTSNNLSPSQHTVEIKQRDYAFNLSNRSYIEVKGFNIFASAVNMANSQHCTIDSCNMKYGDHNSVHDYGTAAIYQSKNIMSGSYNEWKNSTIEYSAHAGMLVYGSYNKVINCAIHDIGYLPTTSAAIATPRSSNNSNQTFSNNTIYNCGYIGIMFITPTKYTIQYNDIYNTCLLVNDGSELYTNNNDGGGTIISHNWTHDNHGNVGMGIYLDNKSSNFIIHHNVSWNNSDSGIRLNLDSTDNLIYNNTILNNGYSFSHYPSSGSQSGTKIINNIANNTINLVIASEGIPPEAHHNGNYPVDASFVPTAGSGAIDTGVIIPGYTDGYVGSAPDVGAYEYGGTYWIPGARLENNPPATINNLTTSNLVSTSVKLNWTSTGDDGTTGTATSYDIRYATYGITSSNFTSAIQCTGEPAPQPSGANQTYTVSGLTADTTYYFAMKAGDDSSNWSGISNVTSGKTSAIPDTTAPQAINNLNITNLSSNTVTLSWTAVGDDGTTGTAASYDIRYYTATITSSNWGSAVQCTNEPAPKIAGNNENFLINNLLSDTTYYFAIKAVDNNNNSSSISNITSGKTLAVIEPVPAGELLTNPGFEGTYSVGIAPGWGPYTYGVTCSQDTNNPHGGSVSQKISVPVLSTTTGVYFRQSYVFKPGTVYEGSVWLKSSDGAVVRLGLEKSTQWYELGAVKTIQLTPTWTKYTIRGGWNLDVSTGSIGIRFISAGTVWMDDASLSEVNTNIVSTQNTIPGNFFGMHICHWDDYNYKVWPEFLQFKTMRLWDTRTDWRDVEPTNNNWNWSRLDLVVSTAVKFNCDLIYNFGRTPTWAASDWKLPPANIADWRNYVNTIATRYKGKIKYWEIWNEVNTGGFYTGTVEQMVEMTRVASEELKAVDSTNIILSPNITRVYGIEWLDKFLNLGGGQYVDVISFHLYDDNLYKPELDRPLVAAVKSLMDNYGVGNKPLWNTEGATGTPPTTDDAAGSLARMYILQWSWGINVFCWYGWDLDVGNPLSQPGYIQPTAAGTAYPEVVKWLRGNQMMNINKDTNGTWIVDIKNVDNSLSYIVWNQNGNRSFNIPGNWSVQTKKDLAGFSVSALPGSSISIGVSPVLLGVNTPIQDTTAPAQINTLTANSSDTNSITLNWTSTGDDGTIGTATSYDIRYATYSITSSNFSGAIIAVGEPTPQVSENSEAFTINNLTTNTTYYFAIKVGDEIPNWSALSNIAIGKTIMVVMPDTTSPNAITNLAVATTSTNTITISWTAPGNDNTTGTASEYDIRYIAGTPLTTDNFAIATQVTGAPQPKSSGNSESITISNLIANTSYYIAIKTKDESNNWSGISNIVSGKTQLIQSGTSPNTISYLTATPQNNNSIQLSWLESTSDNVAGYRIYIAIGNNAIDYTVPSYVISSTETSITINNLANNQEYKFVVRAVDTNGNEDTNTNVISEIAVTDTSDTTQMKLTTPLNGMKISGEKIVLMAGNTIDNVEHISSIKFEYRKVGETGWTEIPSLAGAVYYTQWDISELDNDTQYNIRTVTTYTNGVEVINGYITVTKSEEGDIEETISYKRELIDNRRENIIKKLDTATGLISQVKIPNGVLKDRTTDIVKITVDPQNAPKVSDNLILIGKIHEIIMESGQTEFDKEIEIRLQYKDTNNDNRVDDKDIINTKLMLYTYNTLTSKWEKVTGSVIDTNNKLLTIKTNHLSYYGIFAVLQNDLSVSHVYPNPYKPSIGHTKIYFANLTSRTKVQIYNTAGELVYEDEKDTPTGELTWDVKNNKAENVASGVYMYMITNNAGQAKKGKLAIIR